tara:strand:- start:684 stop:1208 length:525 start_codon:yes stop_codon:yes gene_type:complete
MKRFISVLIIISHYSILLGQYENQAITFKKDDKRVVIEPNKKLYINNSKVVYKSVDYKNMQIKFDDRGELILSFNSINSFRYQETLKIWNILEKTRKYRVLGVFNGGVGGVLSGIVEYGDLPDDQLGRMAKLFAPIEFVLHIGFGGLTGSLIGLIFPDFSEPMIIGSGEWEIVE